MSMTKRRSRKVQHHECSLTAYQKACGEILRSLKTPLSRVLHRSLLAGQHLTLAHCEMPDPDLYTDSSAFARDYLAYGLLRKSVDLQVTVDRQGVCIQKWLQSEETCKRLNRTTGFKDSFYRHGPLDGSPASVISTARAKIHALLGKFDWNEANSRFGFSGGASTRLPRRNGHPFYKFSGKPEVTRNAALLAVCTIWHSPLWRADMQDRYGLDPCNWVEVVEGSRFTTVGKTAIVDRGICIEPCMNMFMQRGIGQLIREKLRHVRVDLNDQTRNQELARIGSATGSLVTIDLAAASDSISLELVRSLLPSDWFDALCITRSEVVIFDDGRKHHLQKISSMGNGFTFELESLIFWAFSSACLDLLNVSDKRLGIYGDDIVIHNSAAEHLINALRCAGFETNVDKTFVSGPFRESCGKHYFYGRSVTPFYVKEQLGVCRTDWYWLANSFNIWVDDTQTYSSFGAARARLKYSCLDKDRRLYYVPATDGLRAGYISTFAVAKPKYDSTRQQYVYYRYVPVRQKHRPNGLPAYLAALASPCADDIMVIEKGESIMKLRAASTSAWDSQF